MGTKNFVKFQMRKFKLTSVDQFIMKRIKKVVFLLCIDWFSKFRRAEVFDRANAENILKFLQEYVLLHGIPRTIRLDQAQCQIGHQIKAFCNQNIV